MEQMTMSQSVLPKDSDGLIRLSYGTTDSGLILLHVNEGMEEIALHAAIAGCYAYNQDPTFLDPAVNREGPSPRGKATSKRAALDNWPRSGSQRSEILAQLIRSGPLGMTRDELERWTRLSGDTIRPRVLELIAGGWLIETEHTRPTRKGNDSVVLLASQKAVEYRG